MDEYAPEDAAARPIENATPRTAQRLNLDTAQPLNMHTAQLSNPRTDEGWALVRQSENSAVQPYADPPLPAVQPYQDQTSVRPNSSNTQPYLDQTQNFTTQKVKVTVRMFKDNVLKFKELCFRLNIDLQDFLEDAAVRELNRRTAEEFNQPSYGSTAHDDMMIFKTSEDIIRAYESMTGNKWNRLDDRVGAKFNHVDSKLVHIAIAICIDRKLHGNTARRPVKSFAYFSGEIEELVKQQQENALPSNVSEYHRYVLAKWETRVLPLRQKKWGPSKSD